MSNSLIASPYVHCPSTPRYRGLTACGRGTATCDARTPSSVREDDPMLICRRAFVAMLAVAGTALVAPVRSFAQAAATPATPMTDTTPQTGYAPVNGLQMYYEVHGSGDPLLLLH